MVLRYVFQKNLNSFTTLSKSGLKQKNERLMLNI